MSLDWKVLVLEPAQNAYAEPAFGSGSDPLKSKVACAVLGLVIEDPSYGYEIWKRFESRFGGFLQVGTSTIYAALANLERAELVERMPGMPPMGVRRGAKAGDPFCATARGKRAYSARLAERMRDDPRRVEMLERLASTGVRGVESALELVDRYEQECLREAKGIELPTLDEGQSDTQDVSEVLEHLIVEERRRMIAAQHGWIIFARASLRALMREESGGDGRK